MNRRDLIKAALGVPTLALVAPPAQGAEQEPPPHPREIATRVALAAMPALEPGHSRNLWDPPTCPCRFVEDFDRRDATNPGGTRTRLALLGDWVDAVLRPLLVCPDHLTATVDDVHEEAIRPMVVLRAVLDAMPKVRSLTPIDENGARVLQPALVDDPDAIRDFTWAYDQNRRLIVNRPKGLAARHVTRIRAAHRKVDFRG